MEPYGWPYNDEPEAPDTNVHEYIIRYDPRQYMTYGTSANDFLFGNPQRMGYYPTGGYLVPQEIHLRVHGELTDDMVQMLHETLFPGMTPDEIRQALEENGETPTRATLPKPQNPPEKPVEFSKEELARLAFAKWLVEQGKLGENTDDETALPPSSDE